MQRIILCLLLFGGSVSAQETASIRVDQFGYMTAMPKLAFWVDPVQGFNAGKRHEPSPRLYLVDAASGEAVHEMRSVLQHEGKIHEASGDRIWHIEFSDFTRPGRYYIVDPVHKLRSWEFVIDRGAVYQELLRQTLRTFYYQRCGISKSGGLSDHACHLGPGQDAECRHDDGQLGSRDLRGGWHDAGDYNKYVGYAYPALKSLLSAYLMQPRLWQRIDAGLPESTGGVPDILHEIKWGLDWLLRMQVRDPSDPAHHGGVLYLVSSELSGGDYYQQHINKPASQDSGRRVYLGVTGQSTAAAASLYAYGAYVFKQAGLGGYARDLELAACLAWQWMEQNPGQLNSSFPKKTDLAASNGQLYGSAEIARLEAALYLHLLTGDPAFAGAARTRYRAALVDAQGQISQHMGPALLYYAFAPNADRDLARAIKNDYQAVWIDNRFYHANRDDAYLNPNYGGAWWGSHGSVCSLAYKVAYGDILGHSKLPLAHRVVAGSLGYIHGRNPLDIVYLTNVGHYGAERYLDRIYHSDSQLSRRPPPAFLPGGPNPKMSGAPTALSSQPALKAFDPTMRIEPAYEYFEGQIALQAHYLQLLTAAITLYGAD